MLQSDCCSGSGWLEQLRTTLMLHVLAQAWQMTLLLLLLLLRDCCMYAPAGAAAAAYQRQPYAVAAAAVLHSSPASL
jgi:hypothetical protein